MNTLGWITTYGLLSAVWAGAVIMTAAREARASQNRFAQIVLEFSEKKDFKHQIDGEENALILEIHQLRPDEMQAGYHYDDSVIRRAVIKDLGENRTELRYVLRDRNVKTQVSEFTEPHRIVIDFFDQHYTDISDQFTGYPMVTPVDGQRPSSSEGPANEPEAPGSTPAGEATSSSQFSVEASGPRKYRLMQPISSQGDQVDLIMEDAGSAPDGLGMAWREYPQYIYRFEVYPYLEAQKSTAGKNAKEQSVLSQWQSLADYAAKQYDLGHEARALKAYQQILQQAPLFFDRHDIHLWRMAEAYLGSGDLSLAEGYYEAMLHKHSGSDLSPLVRIRLIDVHAIRLIRLGQYSKLGELVSRLDDIRMPNIGEASALVVIRKSMWAEGKDPNAEQRHVEKIMPNVSRESHVQLRASLKTIESNRSQFFAQALVLRSKLDHDKTWTADESRFYSEFMQRFYGPATEPWRSQLAKDARTFVARYLNAMSSSRQFLDLVKTYESLPKDLHELSSDPELAWILAQAYRQSGQDEQALKLIDQVASHQDPVVRLMSSLAGIEIIDGVGGAVALGASPGGSSALKKHDQQLNQGWQDLKGEDRQRFVALSRGKLEGLLDTNVRSQAPFIILLDTYEQVMNPSRADAAEQQAAQPSEVISAQSVLQKIAPLALKFEQLSMPTHRRRALALLRGVDPAVFEQDQQSKRAWSQQLIALAEEYRVANDYLEAGRVYSLAGSTNPEWEGSAESLFKGGLLLYRAGRREEAVQAFEKASQDTSNRYYAEMAKERLDKLTQ